MNPKLLPTSVTTIKAVVMDFGNTLVDYPLMDWESQIRFTQMFFARYPNKASLGLADDNACREIAIKLNTENRNGSVWPFKQRLRSTYFFGEALRLEDAVDLEVAICQAVFDEAAKFDDALDCVKRLKKLGLRTAIVSNLPWGTSADIWKMEFYRHGFDPRIIDEIVCCVDVGYRKPHPAPLIECIRRLRCDPKETLFVGDGITSDVGAAVAAGCRPVLLDRHNAHVSFSGVRIQGLNELEKELINGRFRNVRLIPHPRRYYSFPLHGRIKKIRWRAKAARV